MVKQFKICLGVVVILLLNVVEVFSVCGGALLNRPCMVFQRMHVVPVLLRVCVPSIGFVYVFCMSEAISSFKSLRAGSQVFSLLMLFLCVNLHSVVYFGFLNIHILCAGGD